MFMGVPYKPLKILVSLLLNLNTLTSVFFLILKILFIAGYELRGKYVRRCMIFVFNSETTFLCRNIVIPQITLILLKLNFLQKMKFQLEPKISKIIFYCSYLIQVLTQ